MVKSKGEDYKGCLNFKDFVLLGYKLLNDDHNSFNLEEIDLYDKLILIHRYKNSKILYKKKYCFFKDATASGLQILGLLLSPKNDEVKKWLNFNDDGYWYDTYYYLIDLFLKKNIINNDFKKYFTRKTLKKSCMLFNYQASYNTCLTDFLTNVGSNISAHDKVQIINFYLSFFKHLDKIFTSTEIFRNESFKLYWFLIYSNPQLHDILYYLIQNDNLKTKLKTLFKKMLQIDEKWFNRFSSEKISVEQYTSPEYNTFFIDIKDLIDSCESKNLNIQNFFKFLKTYKLLPHLQSYFKSNKPINSLTYSTLIQFSSLFNINLIKEYLTYTLNTSINIFDQFFLIKFDDGFSINFDYVTPITEKYDIKIRHNEENAVFWNRIHIDYNLLNCNVDYIYRSTFQIQTNSQEINFDKLESSFKANFIHSVDAYIIRKLILKSKGNLLTIHDSFGCDLLTVNYNLNLIKECYSTITMRGMSEQPQIKIRNTISSNFIML